MRSPARRGTAPRLAFDARLAGSPTGIGRWTDGLLEGIARVAPEREVIVFGPSRAHGLPSPSGRGDGGEGSSSRRFHRVAAFRSRFLVWQHAVLPVLLAHHGARAFVSPLNLVACGLRGIAQIAFLHDLIPLAPRETTGLPPWHGYKFRLNVRVARRLAARLVCVSRATARQAVRTLGFPADRVRVVHPGIAGCFRPPPPAEVREAARRRGFDGPYVLAVCGNEPRKGSDVLVRALPRLPSDLAVAVAGPEWPHAGAVALPPPVRRLGVVPDADLPALYAGAAALVYPSRLEGFGLPPLEAMACGTPVVAAAAGAIPEATEGAAVLVPPDDPAALAAAVTRIVLDAAHREDISRRGLARAAGLTWERAARAVLDVVDEVA